MAVVRKKQDDTNLKILRELVASGGGNRQCFDCGQKGPTYVNMTIGSFVCTQCSGILRGLTPPHRVKSISMATFTQEEIEFLKSHGNDVCAKTWLGLWDPKRIVHQDQRELIIDKYERKRYYLEPASPLKSLTNATKVSNLSSSNNSISSTSNSSSSNSNCNGNTNTNNNNSSNNSTKSSNENFKNISITPPTSLRITANGIVNGSAHSNRQNRYNFPSDDNSNKITNGTLVNGLNGIGNSINHRQVISKSSLNSSMNSNSSQSFTPDSDFVADFSSANIFNAATQNPLNGLKVQQHQHQHQHSQNGTISNGLQSNNFINGGGTNNHVGLTNATNANENFADFDHAPIYNAAGAYQISYCSNINSNPNSNLLMMNVNKNCFNSNAVQAYSNSFGVNFNSNCNNNNNNNNFNNFFGTSNNSNANLNGTGSSVIMNSNSNNNNNYNSTRTANLNNLQWNVWQQFQWPSFSTLSSSNTEQNRWSLPMLNSSSNSMSSSATYNLNSSTNSTPPADRYAALKDLDEQLRESKAAAAAAAVVDNFSNSMQVPSSTVNPFKTNPPTNTPQVVNPFQTNFNQTANVFGTSTQQNTTNAFNPNPGFNMQPISSFNNGYTSSSSSASVVITNGSNGCGFGLGNQQITTGSVVPNLKNPFATSSLNSNNPFL